MAKTNNAPFQRTHYVADIPANGEKVRLAGWVHEIRDLGKLKFVILRDTTGTVQLVIKDRKMQDAVAGIGREDVVAVSGAVKQNEKAPGGHEVLPESIEVISKAATPLPTEIGGRIQSNLDTRLDWRSLDLRNPSGQAIFRLQSKVIEGFQEYLLRNKFMQVFTPCIIGQTSEGGAEVFPVVYFDKQAFLRQDPQLHRQLCIAAGFDRIFDIGPSWRAELSHTVRHLCEHRTVAVELAFIRDEYDTMKVEEEMVAHAIKKVMEDCGRELQQLNIDMEVPKTPFPVIEFPEVYKILEGMGKKIEFGEDYDRESEMLLGKYAKEKYHSDFIFVNRFPSKVKTGFYIMKDDGDPFYARSVDLIFRGVEQSSGGQREHRYGKLMENVAEKGVSPQSVEWFTRFFKYGVPPHGGFALGVERFTKQLTGVENIREATLFPRDPERLEP